ncbi:hypothetical protein Nepgr_020387 [Nepenthes gracilis]|uniref:Uncharacterized protein n=1 Tax=Nepenthes gracilis TaxID=150966 RepID=A0AAD3SYX7_NEPGR|nr:hypothetical protein Nepgr_020387 [Nepenthes gracilis]
MLLLDEQLKVELDLVSIWRWNWDLLVAFWFCCCCRRCCKALPVCEAVTMRSLEEASSRGSCCTGCSCCLKLQLACPSLIHIVDADG